MPRAKWKTNLVNAFPIPEDRKPEKAMQKAKEEQESSEAVEELGFKRMGTFALLDLPPELRTRIYNLVLFNDPTPLSARDLYQHEILPACKNLSLLVLNKRIHAEATHLLYSTATFRLLPLQDFLALPTLTDLAPHYRTHITRLSITLGSSWTAPPASWKVGKGLARCLARMRGVRVLRVFVTLDPSQPMFEKYRISHEFYTDFCGELLRDVLKAMPKALEAVELAGYEHVEPDGPLVSRLRDEAEARGKIVVWGRDCGWHEKMTRTNKRMLVTR